MTTEANTKAIFANNLNFHLKMINKKKADLARYLGCSTGLVSAWCAGQKMPPEKLKSLLDFLSFDSERF